MVGEFGAWTPIAAQQISTGYEVALEEVGSGLYGVWDTDSSGNWTSAPISNVSGTSAALESAETSFNFDLNGDGAIGAPAPTVIEVERLDEPADGRDQLPARAERRGNGPLSYGGSPVTVGQFGGWTPVAATQTASGYEVALKLAGSDQFTMWNLDSNGNYLFKRLQHSVGIERPAGIVRAGFR